MQNKQEMKEEQFLKQHFGTRTGFTVPDGYFEQMQAQIMQQLPESNARVVKLRPARRAVWRPFAAAACACAVIFGVGAYVHRATTAAPAAALVQTASADAHLQQAADYMMLDSNDIYAYLADNQ